MTRSGCASAILPRGRSPLISGYVVIGHTNSVNSVARSIRPLLYARGWRRPATPSATPPQRGRRMPGLELVLKADAPSKRCLPGIAGTGITARPVEGSPPTGATDAGGRPQFDLAAGERQRDKSHRVTLFHPHKNAALTLRTRTRDDVTHIGRCRHGFTGHFENYVASREPVVGSNAV